MSEVAMKNDFPKGWEEVSIEQVATISTGKRDANHATDNGEYTFFTCAFEPLRADTYAFDDEALLLPGNGHNVGEVFYYKGKFEAYQRTYVIHEIKVLPKYLFYHLKYGWRKATDQKQYGSATNYIRIGNFYDYRLSVAPLEQQKRIVAKIEELFSHIDAGIAALNKAKQLLKQYRQSVLKAAVTGELLGAEFPESTFKSIEFGLESLGQGWSPRCEKEPSPDEHTWGVIKTTAVQSLEYRQVENKRLPDALEPRPKHQVLAGDLLVTRAGPRVRVGICCLVKETRPKLMICDKVYRLRVKEDVILPEYLEIVLNAPNVLSEIEKLKSGISDSGVNLTQTKFVQLKIPYPLIKDQNLLIQIVSEKVDSISRLDKEIENKLLKSDKNKQSILASAFSGALL